MLASEIFERVKNALGDKGIAFRDDKMSPYIKVEPAELLKVAGFLYEQPDLQFKSLMSLSCVDYPLSFTIVYHLFSMTQGHKITIKVELPKDNPVIPTVENIWKTANWHEREAYDLFGVSFAGHSNLVRILLPDDWAGHPMRKDYKYPATYHGVKL